jgi:outer membrane lipoprotein-sorting protein
MVKKLRYSFLALSIGVLISSFAATACKAQNAIGEVYRRMDLNNRALQSLTADVTMVKNNPQLNTYDTTSGKASYLPKTAKRVMYIRVDWTRPVQESMAVIGDAYELYRPALNQVYVGKTTKAQNNASVGNALAFMSMSSAQLKANYSSAFLGKEQLSGGVETAHLELKPNSPANYKSAEIWVDADGMPRQAKINEQNGDSTTVLLSNIQKNIRLDGRMFKLNYPSSVKKIKA